MDCVIGNQQLDGLLLQLLVCVCVFMYDLWRPEGKRTWSFSRMFMVEEGAGSEDCTHSSCLEEWREGVQSGGVVEKEKHTAEACGGEERLWNGLVSKTLNVQRETPIWFLDLIHDHICLPMPRGTRNCIFNLL